MTINELRAAKRDIATLTIALDLARKGCTEYRTRASKAEQECAEWKARFDLLLRQPAQTRGPDYVQSRPTSNEPPKLPTTTSP